MHPACYAAACCPCSYQQNSRIVLFANLHHRFPQTHRLRDALQGSAGQQVAMREGGVVGRRGRGKEGSQEGQGLRGDQRRWCVPLCASPTPHRLRPSAAETRGCSDAVWPHRSAPAAATCPLPSRGPSTRTPPCPRHIAPCVPEQHALLGFVRLLQSRRLHPQLDAVGQRCHAARQNRLGVLRRLCKRRKREGRRGSQRRQENTCGDGRGWQGSACVAWPLQPAQRCPRPAPPVSTHLQARRLQPHIFVAGAHLAALHG